MASSETRAGSSKISPHLRFLWGVRGCLLLLLLAGNLRAQIPFEVFGGHQRTTVDLMFFRFIPKDSVHASRWLFFNRNRASVDYRMGGGNYLPLFGFTEALSYNHEKLKGFAPVVVGQVLSWGVFPKAGIQFARVRPRFTVFSWLVSETLPQPELDYFLLVRYTPRLTQHLDLFTQGETLNTLPTEGGAPWLFTQRFRLGLQIQRFQVGLGVDLNQSSAAGAAASRNWGGFLRHIF